VCVWGVCVCVCAYACVRVCVFVITRNHRDILFDFLNSGNRPNLNGESIVRFIWRKGEIQITSFNVCLGLSENPNLRLRSR